jgi:MFS family permease
MKTLACLLSMVGTPTEQGLLGKEKADRMRSGDEGAIGYHGWRVVSAGFMGVMLGYSVLIPYTFGIFLKPLASSFGWRRDSISIALSCVAITIAICAPLLGRLLDSFGPRRTILPCIVLFSMAFASLALLTPNIWQMYATFVILGLVGNGTTPLAYSGTVASWFYTRRGVALSIISGGAGVGAMILPILAAYLLHRLGWRSAYAVLGLLVLGVSFPLTALLVRESPASSRIKKHADWRTLRSAFKTRPFQFLVIAIFLYSVSFNAVISHLAALLTDRGFTLQHSAGVVSVVGAFGLAGRLLTGPLLDRFFGPSVSFIFFCTTVLAIVLLSDSSIVGAYSAAALLGFAAGGESDITPYLLSRYFGLRGLSTLYGMAWAAFGAGTAVGPVLMGKLYVITGSYQTWGIRLLIAPVAISAVLMMLMPKYPATLKIGSQETPQKLDTTLSPAL